MLSHLHYVQSQGDTASPVAAPTGQGTKPNIIIMQPDDLQFFDEWTPPPNNPNEIDLQKAFPAYGLPNIESLRLNGLQMMQAYTASPVCGTSRYSTITGKYPSRAASSRAAADEMPHSVSIPTTKLVDRGGINDCSNENIAAQFQSNGYSTAMIGKFLSPGFLNCTHVKYNTHDLHLLKNICFSANNIRKVAPIQH